MKKHLDAVLSAFIKGATRSSYDGRLPNKR